MAPQKAEDLKAGMQFKSGSIIIEIIRITGSMVEYFEHLYPSSPHSRTLEAFFLAVTMSKFGWQYVEKPLDQAMKKLDELYKINPHVPKVCKHTNIKGDTWFTSKIYKHCLDCGAALD